MRGTDENLEREKKNKEKGEWWGKRERRIERKGRCQWSYISFNYFKRQDFLSDCISDTTNWFNSFSAWSHKTVLQWHQHRRQKYKFRLFSDLCFLHRFVRINTKSDQRIYDTYILQQKYYEDICNMWNRCTWILSKNPHADPEFKWCSQFWRSLNYPFAHFL